jgi:hypothetical protein
MKFSSVIFLYISFLLISISSAQTTKYFIKYKDFVSKSEVRDRINSKNILSTNKNSLLKTENISVDYFAKGIAKDIDELSRIVKLTFSSEQQVENFLANAADDPSIEYIQRSNVYQVDYTPNDSLISEQWALNKIQAFNAWDITLGADTVLIGIIDTGIDFNHLDLHSQIYLNPGENGIDVFGNSKRTNNIDDDGNDFIDDYMGWDFTDRVGFPFDSTGGDYLGWDNNPTDEQGHGTYIAGIAGANINNINGIAGTAPGTRLLNIRAFDPNGYGEEDDVAAGILYAVQMGAKIINMSFGDDAFSFVLRDIVRYAYSRGVVLIASAGNSGSSSPHYPSGYSEVICVGNSTSDDFVAGSSNFGSTIDLVAPGSRIMTTAKDNNYAIISGTSASAPFVSGAAAMILSLENFTNEEVKQILKSTTDDIEAPGWDLKSGAGRLNLFKALSVIAPSKIKINNPTQDFAASANTLEINATVLSPYFKSYDLYYGVGLNPDNWFPLIQNGLYQFSNQNIYSLNISSFADTVYNLRLVVYLSNGRTLEERVNFYVDRSAPIGELISEKPITAFYGNRTTVLAAVFSNEPSIVRMYYRKLGETNFNFVTLDGFAANNQFVKELHYGFIPTHLVEQNVTYQIYFQLENLVGLKSTIIRNNDSLFNVTTGFDALISPEIQLPYSLNKGSIFKNPTNFLSQNFNEVLFSEFYPTQDLYFGLYKLEGNNFVKIDSIKNKLPRDVGDFNFNGKIDLLSSIQRDGYIDEQVDAGSFSFTNKFSDSTGTFWPVLAQDIDLDGTTEVIVVDSDTSLTIWKVNSNLGLSNPIKLSNFTPTGFGGNIIDAPHSVITDADNDGKNEIWMVDRDGDIFSYEIQNANTYLKDKVFSTEFLGSSALLDAGDYNGDGFPDIAVLIHSIDEFDIAPFYRLLIFTFATGKLTILHDQAFIDASVEFNGSFRSAESSIRFADLDLDGRQELIVFVFPYSYIFKSSASKNSVISYKENVNSSSIFVGDLNGNGVKEVAFPTNQGIKFYEFAFSQKANTPFDLTGYSQDSSSIYLKWMGFGNKYYIYRGDAETNLVLLDSVLNTQYTDLSVSLNKNYYYAVKSYDISKPDPISNFSGILKVYSHIPANIQAVTSTTAKSITVTFTERIGNTIDNLSSFTLVGLGIPNSISPQNQKSLLLTFNKNLPVGNNSLIIKDIHDYYGSPIETDTVTFNVDSTIIQQEQFFISSHQLINPYKVKITFNLDVDESSAQNSANYIFEPAINVTSIMVDQSDRKSLYLSWDKQKPVGSVGKEYVLRIRNLKSTTQTGNVDIASGAGSYLVLTSFAKDLSDVYVYPQPAKIQNGLGKITFANLPKKAKILILNLQGKQIAAIEENNGDGGVEFILKDQNGDALNTGIYIYRIERLDNSGNEVEEKIGKFAVIR